MILSIQEILQKHPLGKRAEPQIYKFVRLPEKRYVFCLITFGCLNHDQLFQPKEGPAETAGSIRVTPENWNFISQSSSTLNIGTDELDESLLTNLLKRPYQDQYS